MLNTRGFNYNAVPDWPVYDINYDTIPDRPNYKKKISGQSMWEARGSV